MNFDGCGVRNEFISIGKLSPWNSSTRAGCGGSGIDFNGLVICLAGDINTGPGPGDFCGVVGLEDPSTKEEAEDRSGVIEKLEGPLIPFVAFSLLIVSLLAVDSDLDLFGVKPPASSSLFASVPAIFATEALFCNQPPKPLFCPEDDLLLPSPVSPIFDCAVAEVTACTKLENEEPNDRRPNAGLVVGGGGDGGGVDTDFGGSLKSLKLSPSSGKGVGSSVSVEGDSARSGVDVRFRLGVGGGVSSLVGTGGVSIAGTRLSCSRDGGGGGGGGGGGVVWLGGGGGGGGVVWLGGGGGAGCSGRACAVVASITLAGVGAAAGEGSGCLGSGLVGELSTSEGVDPF